ncbi:hypothetical protein Ahia01_000436100 [Argonauta hians]
MKKSNYIFYFIVFVSLHVSVGGRVADSSNVERILCTGSFLNYTCNQVTGIDGLGLYFQFDVVTKDTYFLMNVTVNTNNTFHVKLPQLKVTAKKILLVPQSLPLYFVFYSVRRKANYNSWCVMLTLHANNRSYIRSLGCHKRQRT